MTAYGIYGDITSEDYQRITGVYGDDRLPVEAPETVDPAEVDNWSRSFHSVTEIARRYRRLINLLRAAEPSRSESDAIDLIIDREYHRAMGLPESGAEELINEAIRGRHDDPEMWYTAYPGYYNGVIECRRAMRELGYEDEIPF